MRILVISDIHANLVALETVLNDAQGRYDTIWCLGDIVGYGPRPNECVALVRERAALCVIGNHDWAALDRPGVNVDDFNPHARQAILWTQEQLSAQSRAYLDGLPETPIRPLAGEALLVTHASPREPVWEYILTPTVALQNFMAFDELFCLVGHTHKPAIFQWRLRTGDDALGLEPPVGMDAQEEAAPTSGSEAPAVEEGSVPAPAGAAEPGAAEPGAAAAPATPAIVTVSYLQPQPAVSVRLPGDPAPDQPPQQRLILNPGSVGQPRDNDARAAYAILDLDARSWRCERVAYPVELTQSQMRDARLPRRLIDRLSFGW
jgi:predicted phosphodiesterase